MGADLYLVFDELDDEGNFKKRPKPVHEEVDPLPALIAQLQQRVAHLEERVAVLEQGRKTVITNSRQEIG